MENILARVSESAVRTDPFPYIVVEDALPHELADRLLEEFPSLETITQGASYLSNQRFSYNASDCLANEHISDVWRQFVREHIGAGFYRDFVRLFGPSIWQIWPELADRLTASEVSLGLRNRDRMEGVDAVLDCQVCLNTPVTGRSSAVKIAHLDNPHELFAGLLYLRPADDDSIGGDLKLYRYRQGTPRFHGPRLVDRRYVERVTTVPYRHNTLVLFLNTFDALHGVTPRAVTDRPRYLVNFLGEVKEELFDLRPYRERPWHQLMRHLPH